MVYIVVYNHNRLYLNRYNHMAKGSGSTKASSPTNTVSNVGGGGNAVTSVQRTVTSQVGNNTNTQQTNRSTPITKAEQVRNFVSTNQLDKAIKMASSFKRDFNKTEMRTIQIAKDVLAGRASFYKQLGIDTDKTVAEARKLVKNRYSN